MRAAIRATCVTAGVLILLLALRSGMASDPMGAAAIGTSDTARTVNGEPNYTIRAIRYATLPKFPLDGLVIGGAERSDG
jgi:hypothetical protein